MLFPPKPFIASSPYHNASYSASLLVAKKDNLRDFSRTILFGEMMTTPTPEPHWLAVPSMYIVHGKEISVAKTPNSFLALYTLLGLIL